MKRTIGFLLGILFYSISSNAQIQLTANGETLYIEIEGITNLKNVLDNDGNPTNNYTYRRENFNIDMTVRPHINIVGGTCIAGGYNFGSIQFETRYVTGFHYWPDIHKYLPEESPIVDSVSLLKASGTTGFSGQIDFSRHYKTQHSLSIQIQLYMWDWLGGCPTATSCYILSYIYPEPTVQELAMTARANVSKSDQVLWKEANCNVCNKKGVPGFNVNTVTLMPGFSDQDYGYSSVGPDLDFSRYFTNPGITGMFGGGWNFFYEQEIIQTPSMVQYLDGRGANELFHGIGNFGSPYSLRADFSNKKRMLYYETENRIEIFDPDTKLFSDFQYYTHTWDTLRYQLSRIRDMNGNMVTLSYYFDRIKSITDAAGRTTSFQYDALWRCTQMTLPDGRSCSYEYNTSGQLSHITDIYANDVKFAYDIEGYITMMRVNQDSATFSYYTENGHRFLVSVTNLDGNTTTYYPAMALNFRENMITDPSGKAVIYQIDPKNGATIAKKDVATGAISKMIYNENKMLIDYFLPSGDSSKTVYDSLKRVHQTIDFRGMASSFLYDSLDNITEYTNAEGHTWKWCYNEQCRITQSLTPLGKTETFTWYPNGLLRTHSYDSSQTHTYNYDQFGNISSILYPTGGTGSYEYDQFGLRCTGYTDPLGNHTTYEYDALDRITKATHPDGSNFTTMYDCCAPTGTIDENGQSTRVERTPLLQITKETDAEGNVYNYTLDGANRVVEMIRPDNTKYQYTYNSLGKLELETDPFNESAQRTYDLNGLLNAIADQSGNVSTFQRSENGMVTALNIGGNTVTYNRDSLDRVISYINSWGQTVNYDYNADGFVQSISSTGINDQYVYDGLNRLSSSTNAAGTVSIGYNEMNSINQLTCDDRQFNFYYDLNNDLVKTRYSDNSEAILKRDNRGRVTSLIIGTDSVGFAYDATSNLLNINRSNGVNTLIRRNKVSKIMALRLFNQTDTLMKWNYTRNAMGYLTREECAGILCSDTVFMPADTGGLYQQGNQLSQWQHYLYTYDGDGNLIQVNPGILTASYDNLNRLTEWIQDGGMVKAQYFYNAQGFVAKKQVQNGASTFIFHFFYDAKNRVIEISQEGSTAGWKFYYNDYSLIACQVGTDFYFYHYDHQGNTVALTDRNGNIVKTYAYDAWGKILKETGTLDQPFKYSGAWGVMHEYNYLYRMPFRFYDSYTGKFIQRDPSGFQNGVNLYKYAGNNPLNYVDPTGLVYEGGGGEQGYTEYNGYKTDDENKAYQQIQNDRAANPNYDIDNEVKSLDLVGNMCYYLTYVIPFTGLAYDVAVDLEKKGTPDTESLFYYSIGLAKSLAEGVAKIPYAIAKHTYNAGKSVIKMAVEDDVKPPPYIRVNRYEYMK